MSQTVRVSKSGSNVLTATNPNDFIFHSDYNTFKILAEGILLAQTVDADPKQFTVSHSQGEVVGAYALAKFPDGYVALPAETDRAFTSTGSRRFYMEVDDNTINFIFYKGATANYNVDIKYYLFEIPGS